MKKLEGELEVSSEIAYCPQEAWIQNATLRDNILFGKPLDNDKLEKVYHVCALQKDLDMMEYGKLF